MEEDVAVTVKQKEEKTDDASPGEAGFVRALTRTYGTIYRMIFFGQLPNRVPVKSISIVTDRLGNVIEQAQILHASHKQQHPGQRFLSKDHQQHEQEKTAIRNLKWRSQLLGKTLAVALPQLAKSALLGGAVFSIYEELMSRVEETFTTPPPSPDNQKHPSYLSGAADPRSFLPTFFQTQPHQQIPRDILITLGASSTAGLIAGASHGILYSCHEHLQAAVLRLRGQKGVTVNNVWIGTTGSHALSHGMLFGSYEASKKVLLHTTGSAYDSPMGFICVATAGSIAGAAEELTSHLTTHWEEEGVASLRKSWARQGLPTTRSMIAAAPAAALGFLAFEYGKRLTSSEEEEEDI